MPEQSSTDILNDIQAMTPGQQVTIEEPLVTEEPVAAEPVEEEAPVAEVVEDLIAPEVPEAVEGSDADLSTDGVARLALLEEIFENFGVLPEASGNGAPSPTSSNLPTEPPLAPPVAPAPVAPPLAASAAPPSPSPVPEDVEFITTTEQFSDVLTDRGALNKLLNTVRAMGAEEGRRVVQEAIEPLPGIVGRQVGLRMIEEKFFGDNPHLVEYAPVVGKWAKNLQEMHPDWATTKVVNEAGKIVNAALKNVGRKPEAAVPTNGTGARPAPKKAVRMTPVQRQLSDMVNYKMNSAGGPA